MRKIIPAGNGFAYVSSDAGPLKWQGDVYCWREQREFVKCHADCAACDIGKDISGCVCIWCNAMFTHNPIGELVEPKP